MNILLINHYAGSPYHGMEFRPYYMAREWVKAGHRVTIAASSFSHLRKEAVKFDGGLTEEIIDGIRYVWLKNPQYHGNGVIRAINILSFVVGMALNRGRIVGDSQGVDAVIASSTYPLDIFPAWLIARKYKAKLIFEVHDLWPLSPMELGGMSKWHPFIMTMQLAEDFACRHADAAISMLPHADIHLTARGMEAGKYYYLPNGIVPEEWVFRPAAVPEQHQDVITRAKAEGKYLVGYAGSHGMANSLDYYIEAAGLLKNYPVRFLLIGRGPEKERLMSKAASLGNVIFLPAVPKEAIPTLLYDMDILYLGWRRSKLYRFGISPNKLMDYMMAGKSIVHAVEAGNDPVAESGCGISVAPEDPEKIAEALKKLMDLSPAEREAIGRRGKEYVMKNHDYKILAAKFLDVMGAAGGTRSE